MKFIINLPIFSFKKPPKGDVPLHPKAENTNDEFVSDSEFEKFKSQPKIGSLRKSFRRLTKRNKKVQDSEDAKESIPKPSQACHYDSEPEDLGGGITSSTRCQRAPSQRRLQRIKQEKKRLKEKEDLRKVQEDLENVQRARIQLLFQMRNQDEDGPADKAGLLCTSF